MADREALTRESARDRLREATSMLAVAEANAAYARGRRDVAIWYASKAGIAPAEMHRETGLSAADLAAIVALFERVDGDG